MKRFALFFSALATLACGAPAIVTPAPEQPTPVSTLAPVGVSTDNLIDTCTIVATTDTNIRSCGNIACEDVGDIFEGETVTGVCSGKWITLGFGRYACIPALVGTGGCE